MKKELLVIVSIGFALFSMFFGSGNLVFPIGVGVESEGHYFMASLGILCTCVFFPLLGMIGMMLYKGDIQAFFSCFGKRGAFIFSFLALSLMGPFGVLARCLTVIHGALLLLFPNILLTTTSFIMCLAIFILAANKNRILTILGTVLTPCLLLSIAVIVFYSYGQDATSAGSLSESMTTTGWEPLKNGFFKGYQTMDLVASFFFSGFGIKHLYETSSNADEAKLFRIFLKSSLFGALLLYLVYFALVFLGDLYAPMLSEVSDQEMFGQIALASLGSMAAPCVCITVILACLTTAIALTSLFAQFIRTEVAQEKIGNNLALFITITIAFFVSTLEFAGIANFLGPILEIIYPALITLTIMNILCKIYGFDLSHWPFTVTLAAKLVSI